MTGNWPASSRSPPHQVESRPPAEFGVSPGEADVPAYFLTATGTAVGDTVTFTDNGAAAAVCALHAE